MNLDAGRSQLYSALKTARQRWKDTGEAWADLTRQEFEEQVWGPLESLSAEALRAIDELAQILTQARRECEAAPPILF
ncbi:MAG TPA: hypothetical protein VIL46_16485 [Gemmataceae bacterium]